MKKNLALLLAVVLVMTSMFALGTVAGAETKSTAPSQEIAYFNVSIKTNVSLLFAVPADGYTVNADGTVDGLNLLVWQNGKSDGTYYMADAAENGAVLEAQGIEIIGSKKHLIFSYAGLSAAQMSELVYARVCYSENGSDSYGEVCSYSILEFANKYLNTSGAKEIELVSAMMDYGYFAAIYNNKINKTNYIAYDAEDAKNAKPVTISTKINGSAISLQTTRYALSGETITLAAPAIKGASIDSWSENDIDANKDGVQCVVADAGLDLLANYKTTNIVYADAEGSNSLKTKDGYVSSIDSITYPSQSYVMSNGAPVDIGVNLSAQSTTTSAGNYYHEMASITDPNNSKNKVLRWTLTSMSAISAHIGNNTDKKAENFTNAGFGDTTSTINFEMELGGYNGMLAKTGSCYQRTRLTLKSDAAKYLANGKTTLDVNVHFFKVQNGKLYIGNGAKVVGVIPTNGMQKFVVSVDYKNRTVTGYMKENDQLVAKATISMLDSGAITLANQASGVTFETLRSALNLCDANDFTNLIPLTGVYDNQNVTKHETQVWWFGAANFNGNKNLNVNLNGVDTPIHDGTGWNLLALQKYAQDNFSILIDNFTINVGDFYK